MAFSSVSVVANALRLRRFEAQRSARVSSVSPAGRQRSRQGRIKRINSLARSEGSSWGVGTSMGPHRSLSRQKASPMTSPVLIRRALRGVLLALTALVLPAAAQADPGNVIGFGPDPAGFGDVEIQATATQSLKLSNDSNADAGFGLPHDHRDGRGRVLDRVDLVRLHPAQRQQLRRRGALPAAAAGPDERAARGAQRRGQRPPRRSRSRATAWSLS